MKITIDTKEDSEEEIKKVIQLLSALLGNRIKANTDLFSSENSWGENQAPSPSSVSSSCPPGEGKPIDFSSFLNLMDKTGKEKKKDSLQIIPY